MPGRGACRGLDDEDRLDMHGRSVLVLLFSVPVFLPPSSTAQGRAGGGGYSLPFQPSCHHWTLPLGDGGL